MWFDDLQDLDPNKYKALKCYDDKLSSYEHKSFPEYEYAREPTKYELAADQKKDEARRKLREWDTFVERKTPQYDRWYNQLDK